MPPPKGKSNNPRGRDKGVPNKATTQAREAIAAFVEGNVERLNGWLDEIALKDAKQAFDCFMGVVEYHIPKLARQDTRFVDEDGNDKDMTVTLNRIVYNAPDRDK